MVSRIPLILFLMFMLSTVLVTPTAAAYPFEDLFRKDLLDIANSTPKIENIYIKNWLDIRPTGLLVFIRISYTAGLSDYEKISLQDYVQNQLESKWYIDFVERNGYVTIPGVSPPWPGFVIGDLNIGIKIPISAEIDINPSTLNFKNTDRGITASIKLPKGYDVGDIDVSKTLLNYQTIPIENSKITGKTLKVLLNWSNVIDSLGLHQPGEVKLTITGFLFSGRVFEGSDTIRVS